MRWKCRAQSLGCARNQTAYPVYADASSAKLKGTNEMIRLAQKSEIQDILKIYSVAKKFMRENGNPTQWNGSYPDKETLLGDIDKKHLFVCEEADSGELYGCFALIGGDDPTYAYIEGKWKSAAPYAAIHRIASNGTKKGVFCECVRYARTKYDHLRVDTHEDNIPMQRAILKNGFEYTGIIYLENGSPRMAYEWPAE